jgi:hypothetical protein
MTEEDLLDHAAVWDYAAFQFIADPARLDPKSLYVKIDGKPYLDGYWYRISRLCEKVAEGYRRQAELKSRRVE